MGAAALPVIMFTLIWGGVGVVAPYFVKPGPNQRLIRTSLALTGASCWLFWLCCYMSQMNPLIGGLNLSILTSSHSDCCRTRARGEGEASNVSTVGQSREGLNKCLTPYTQIIV